MTSREQIRIPVFNEEFLFNVYEELEIKSDEVNLAWIDEKWEPEIWEKYVGPRYDKVALYELHRLLKFATCPFCRNNMKKISSEIQPGNVFVCYGCYYWGGRGTRGWIEGPKDGQGILGRMNFLENLEDVSEDLLVKHLFHNYNDIIKLTPKKAEKLLPEILKDYLDCEVKAIGGVKDGGIDALAIRSDKSKMIIQIKWREKNIGSETVSVVREVGGTLLSRGIPSGLIISTKSKFSQPAMEEARLISKNEIIGLGKLDIKLADFNNLIDMFNISNKRRDQIKEPQDIIPCWDSIRLFG